MAADPLWYELRNAVCIREFDLAEKILATNPGLMLLRDGMGETVLHFLAVENDSKGVSWLHSRGFDLDTKNDFGTPAIFEVAQLGYKDLFLWFLANGADVFARDGEGHNILESLRECEKPDMRAFVIEHA